MGKMYSGTSTWNPFKGCNFDCTYCEFTFKKINKRIRSCKKCQDYEPHMHEDRLKMNKFPKAKIIFVCGNSDLRFALYYQWQAIIEAVCNHSYDNPEVTYYFQSKDPKVFRTFLSDFPSSVVLGTTLETNRDEGYRSVSKAPLPMGRWWDFRELDYPRKYLTIEPIMDFDMDKFYPMIMSIQPEKVYVGYNSTPKEVQLPEPSLEKTKRLIQLIREQEIEVEEKNMDR